ncbi:hypothetical protein DAMA08_044530 [Martiniozyma asiatica (nom. inval.)]|nr:hypothetical protein DAMA08_044530 [Martiniozyma asiatica]
MTKEKSSLSVLLDADIANASSDDEMVEVPVDTEAMCVDCERMPKELFCLGCDEAFCRVCFQFAHKGGKRKTHKYDVLVEINNPDAALNEKSVVETPQLEDAKLSQPVVETPVATTDKYEAILQKVKRNTRFIPMRLSYEERQLLKLLEAALSVSDYTDNVDIISYTSKSKRIITQLKQICSILAGLAVSSNMKAGQALIQDKNFNDNAEWYKQIFEIGRRYKIMNPERMKDTFGKLCYMVMDSRLPQIKEHMEFDLYQPILTVEKFLAEHADEKSIHLLDDAQILEATADIRPEGKSRALIQRSIKQKERAIEALANKYSSKGGLDKEQIRTVLYSIGDFHAYTNKNRIPVSNMISKLDHYFKDSGDSEKYSLGIRYGQNGARLTHNHEKQFLYVKQALQLWQHVMRDLIELWYLADDDLFNGGNYRLTDTGQGFNRIKTCPLLYKKMYSILHEVQQKFDHWVGIPVIHLGDDAVPNALFFLDKYIQIPTILIPIDKCIEQIPYIARDPYINEYLNQQFDGVEELQKKILCDYFKHGFDGSGADNYYFAGSCVDASSTSSCEFCNNIFKKDYYKVFLLTGFTNFNGEGF